jgi:hypothetical protein
MMTDSDSDAKRCFRLNISRMFQHLLSIVLLQLQSARYTLRKLRIVRLNIWSRAVMAPM